MDNLVLHHWAARFEIKECKGTGLWLQLYTQLLQEKAVWPWTSSSQTPFSHLFYEDNKAVHLWWWGFNTLKLHLLLNKCSVNCSYSHYYFSRFPSYSCPSAVLSPPQGTSNPFQSSFSWTKNWSWSWVQFIAMSILRPLVAAQGLSDSLEVLAHGLQGDKTLGVWVFLTMLPDALHSQVPHSLIVVVQVWVKLTLHWQDGDNHHSILPRSVQVSETRDSATSIYSLSYTHLGPLGT